MTNELKQFVRQILIFSIVIAIIGGGIFGTVLSEYYLVVFPFLLSFFVIVTLAVHYFLLNSTKGRPAQFNTSFVGTTGIKLFVYIIFLGIYIFFNREDALVFTTVFMTLYFLFTIFEVRAILKIIGEQEKQKSK